jgi:hypothetical protein
VALLWFVWEWRADSFDVKAQMASSLVKYSSACLRAPNTSSVASLFPSWVGGAIEGLRENGTVCDNNEVGESMRCKRCAPHFYILKAGLRVSFDVTPLTRNSETEEFFWHHHSTTVVEDVQEGEIFWVRSH